MYQRRPGLPSGQALDGGVQGKHQLQQDKAQNDCDIDLLAAVIEKQAGHGNDTQQGSCGNEAVGKAPPEADFRKVVPVSTVAANGVKLGQPPGNVGRLSLTAIQCVTTIPAVKKDRRLLLVALVLTIKGQQGLKVAGHGVSLYE